MEEGKISWGEFYNYSVCGYKLFLKQTNVVPLGMFNKHAKQHGLAFHEFAYKYFDVFEPFTVEQMKEKKFKDPRFQKFHEFEIERREWCIKNNVPWMPYKREEAYYGKDFMCVVDRIDDNGDGTYTLVEYKNKQTSTVLQQLAFNSFVIQEVEDLTFSRFAVWYASEPENNYGKKPSTVSLNSMKKKMATILPSIRSGYFVAKPGFFCTRCEYSAMGVCNKIGVDLKLCKKCGKNEEVEKND